MEVPKETQCSIRCLAESVAENGKLDNLEGHPNQPQDGASMETTSGCKWIYSQKTGTWEIVKNKATEEVSLLPSSPRFSKA